jgi:N-acetylneuraminate synthase
MAAVRFIAEVSSNHHGELDRCLAFVDRAAEIGCAGVKFQLFRIRDLFAPEALAKRPELLAREAWELPPEFIPEIAKHARNRKLEFSCTPFYLDAVELLSPHVDFFKIASYELLWDSLLQACAKTGKPIVISIGMAVAAEVEHAVSTLEQSGCRDLTILGCTSGYPTPPDQANLAVLESLNALASRRPDMKIAVGWSDHTVEPGVIHRAVHRFGATMVEFHLDIDGQGEEYSTGHCWLPEAIEAVIQAVQLGCDSDGSPEITATEIEATDRDWRADPSDGLRPLLSTRRGLK